MKIPVGGADEFEVDPGRPELPGDEVDLLSAQRGHCKNKGLVNFKVNWNRLTFRLSSRVPSTKRRDEGLSPPSPPASESLSLLLATLNGQTMRQTCCREN